MVGAHAVHELVLGLERLAADAVEPRVDVLVDVAVVVDSLRKSCTKRLCPSSLVRMKKSCDAFRRPGSSCQSATIRSAYSCGASPCSAATRATFDACSSTPVRKNVSLPAAGDGARGCRPRSSCTRGRCAASIDVVDGGRHVVRLSPRFYGPPWIPTADRRSPGRVREEPASEPPGAASATAPERPGPARSRSTRAPGPTASRPGGRRGGRRRPGEPAHARTPADRVAPADAVARTARGTAARSPVGGWATPLAAIRPGRPPPATARARPGRSGPSGDASVGRRRHRPLARDGLPPVGLGGRSVAPAGGGEPTAPSTAGLAGGAFGRRWRQRHGGRGAAAGAGAAVRRCVAGPRCRCRRRSRSWSRWCRRGDGGGWMPAAAARGRMPAPDGTGARRPPAAARPPATSGGQEAERIDVAVRPLGNAHAEVHGGSPCSASPLGPSCPRERARRPCRPSRPRPSRAGQRDGEPSPVTMVTARPCVGTEPAKVTVPAAGARPVRRARRDVDAAAAPRRMGRSRARTRGAPHRRRATTRRGDAAASATTSVAPSTRNRRTRPPSFSARGTRE